MVSWLSALYFLLLGPLCVYSAAPPGVNCSKPGQGCYETRCCVHDGQCYQKKPGWGECLPKCTADDNPGWDCYLLYNWQLKCTAAKGGDCTRTGCCRDPELACYAKNASYAECVDAYVVHGPKKVWYTTATTTLHFREFSPPWETPPHYNSEDFQGVSWQSKTGHRCLDRFVPPEPPLHATDLNGHALPDVCFNGTGSHHVFLIGDWGGILPGHKGNEDANFSRPADHTPFGAHKRYKKDVDNIAQHRVADAMRNRASKSRPDYIINVGDAFYWGGVETHCGLPPFQHADTEQWRVLFEEMYTGDGIDGKQWLGVLGNHDYGGWMFTAGWDQTIGYTWARGPGSTKRWVMPAQYWSARVHYHDFSVDYYFVDTNVFDVKDVYNPSFHNICNMEKSGGSSASCGPQGPISAFECPKWFKKLWEDQLDWFDRELPKSKAEWQVVVTHFPPTWGRKDWVTVSRKHGIDLIITGHRHRQEVHYMDPPGEYYDGWPGMKSNFLDPTAWIVTGGGGGVTSENYPDDDGHDDQYGFVDLTLSKDDILVEMISHGGHVRSSKQIKRWISAIPTPDPELITDAGNEGGTAKGCGNREHTFYLYRAQNDDTYLPENINAATLPGVLWYIHHEVVITCPRKFGITRIRRLKITVKNTCKLYKAKQTQYGPYVPFDSGRCNTKGCESIWKDYGPVVGCQHIPFNTGIFAAYCRMPEGGTYDHCQYAQWFSLPGPCPSEAWPNKTESCRQKVPGGLCQGHEVTGSNDCTFHVEEAGEIRLDDLYEHPIGDIKTFCQSKMEYNNQTDSGAVKFWDGIYSPLQGQKRIKAVRDLFRKKYPHMPERLDDAGCDVYETDPKDYLVRTGSGFPRYPGSAS